MRPSLDFVDLALADRPALFAQIRALVPGELAACEPATFGDKAGWLVSDITVARQILATRVGMKSRPAASQQKLGGIGGAQGDDVRSRKRDLLMALGSVARDGSLLAEHLEPQIRSFEVDTARGGLTDALAAATLTLVADVAPGAFDRLHLRSLVQGSWALIENAEEGSFHDEFFADLLDLLSGSRSAFMTTLRATGWADEVIAEELRAMVLAGWGSTAATVLSARSLGVARDLSDHAVFDEVVRLYPPSFMIARTIARRSRDLPFDLGDTVVISPWLIHRHDRGWRRPLEFDVGRWNSARVEPTWFLPFGMGPRRCPASTFARAQAAVAGSVVRVRPTSSALQVTLVEGRSPALVPASD
jgi:hypothetical protein